MDDEVKTGWNSSIECLRCGSKLNAIAHTFPNAKRAKPFFSYKCKNCGDSGTWTTLARMYGIG